MRFVQFGEEGLEKILLLHGGGLSWWNYEQIARSLGNEYHVILPILNGHAGSDKAFSTIEDNAADIIEYIDEYCGGSVLLIGGLSLGGQILLDILSRRQDICRYAVIESALVRPSRLTHCMIKPAFGSCYGLIRQKWFSRLQFRSLKIRADLFENYFRDTCAISKNDMIAFLQAASVYSLKDQIKSSKSKIFLFVGGKEKGSVKRSAEDIHKALPQSLLRVFPGLRHGELSINRGEDYVNEISKIVRGRF